MQRAPPGSSELVKPLTTQIMPDINIFIVTANVSKITNSDAFANWFGTGTMYRTETDKKNSEKQTKEPNQQKYSNIRETDFFFPSALEGNSPFFVLYQHFLLRWHNKRWSLHWFCANLPFSHSTPNAYFTSNHFEHILQHFPTTFFLLKIVF